MLVSAFGQPSQVQYGDIGPTFVDSHFTYSYAGSFPSIRKIDFRNFSFFAFDKTGNPIAIFNFDKRNFRLKDGHYAHRGNFGSGSVDLDSIYYIPKLNTTDPDRVLVLLSWVGASGSSSQWKTAQVFMCSDSKLRIVQEIEWSTDAGGKESYNSTTNTLVIRSDHYLPEDAHCCISALDAVTFRWNGARFVETGIQTELSEYGKSKRKTLPTSNR